MWLFACLPLLGWWSTGLLDLDEGFYGAVTQEMNRRGEWVTPFFNGKPWFEKPILLYWLAKPSIFFFGEMIGPRLPAVLANIATYAVIAWFARKHYGDRVAQIATLILSGSLLFLAVGRMMMTDPPLVFCLTAAMLTFWESLVGNPRWRLVSAACIGFGVLAKGPVAAILFVLIAGWTFWREPELRAKYRGYWLAGVGIMLAVIASWYWPAYAANGQLFVQKFLIEQNVGRFTGGDAAHTVGLASLPAYIPILFLGMIPWSVWIIPAWPRRKVADTGPLPRFLAAWAAIIFVFFTVSGAKLPHYILPCFPPLAVLVATYLADRKWPLRLGLRMCFGMAVLANVGFPVWYSLSGQAEAHSLIRYVRQQRGDVALYQLSRRNKSLGTGKLKIQETSLPSLFLYLNRTALETDKIEEILQDPNPVWVFTRSDRIRPEDFATVAKAGRKLVEIQVPMKLDHYALYQVR